MRTCIRGAITARIIQWQAEGDTGAHAELRRDAFIHLRWRLER